MDTPTTAAAIGISVRQLWLLMGNPQFATAITSNDGAGGVVFDAGAVATFATTYATAKANGWKLTDAQLPDADFAGMAANPPGAFYDRSPPTTRLDILE
jgi:hypothetical protein